MELSNTGSPLKTSPNTVIWIIAAGLLFIAGGFIIATLTPALFPPQGSAESRQVDDLFHFMFVIGGAIFLLVQGMLVFSVVRFRAKAEDMTDGPHIRGNATLEFVWTIIPAIIVAAIAIYAYQVWVSIRTIKPNEQVVNVTGARFAWTFNYMVTPDTLPEGVTVDDLPEEVKTKLEQDGSLTFSNPQLHAYVDRTVLLQMNATDVIHSLWIPGMRIKQDVMPGRTTEVRFTPIRADNYRIVCAELCGAGHGNMAGEIGPNGELQKAWLVVHPDEESYLREFYEVEAMKILFPPDDPVELGRSVLASGKYPCATCHVLTDLGWNGNIGPNLNGVGDRAGNRVGGQDASTYLHNTLRHPGDYLVPGFGNLMPQFNPNAGEPNYMPDDDLDVIVAYLLSQTAAQ